MENQRIGLGSADALALTPYVDSIVMVVEEGRTAMRSVRKAVEAIPQEKFLTQMVPFATLGDCVQWKMQCKTLVSMISKLSI